MRLCSPPLLFDHDPMHKYPCSLPGTDLFSLIESEARAVAAAFGVKTANEIAAALVDRLHHQVHGDRIYVAKRSKLRKQEVYAAMRREYDGANLSEVAARHGYSRAHTYRIVVKK